MNNELAIELGWGYSCFSSEDLSIIYKKIDTANGGEIRPLSSHPLINGFCVCPVNDTNIIGL